MPKKMPKNTDTNWTCDICKKYERYHYKTKED